MPLQCFQGGRRHVNKEFSGRIGRTWNKGECHFSRICKNDLAPGKFVQTREELLKSDFATINKTMIQILDNFLFSCQRLLDIGEEHVSTP